MKEICVGIYLEQMKVTWDDVEFPIVSMIGSGGKDTADWKKAAVIIWGDKKAGYHLWDVAKGGPVVLDENGRSTSRVGHAVFVPANN